MTLSYDVVVIGAGHAGCEAAAAAAQPRAAGLRIGATGLDATGLEAQSSPQNINKPATTPTKRIIENNMTFPPRETGD